MNKFVQKVQTLTKKSTSWILQLSLIKKSILGLIVIGIIGGIVFSSLNSSKNTVSYQTEKVEKSTIIASVTASGQVTSSNNAAVNTQATGVVTTIDASNGQNVKAGDPIAELDLDQESRQRYNQALASYQSAQNNLASAQNKKLTLQADMFQKWDSFKQLAETNKYTNGDGTSNNDNRALPEFHISENTWLAAESDYKNQDKVITQAQNALSSAWYSLQQSSPTIYAPISGTVSGLSLQVGSVISSQGTSSTSTSITSQKIASVVTTASPMISVNLTEIDIINVKVGDKATLSFDAYPDKTYTGKVVSVDTIGSVSSGVTNYPTLIALDTTDVHILPNMSVTASIITDTKTDVLAVSTAAVKTQDGVSTVQVMKNGNPESTTVQIGISSDTQTEITSGLTEGDTVVIGSTSKTSSTSSSNSSASPFGGGFGGGGQRVLR